MNMMITFKEFLVLNQDEDVLVTVYDYMTDDELISKSWKSDIYRFQEFKEYKDWKVEYFGLTKDGMDIYLYNSKNPPLEF